MPKSFRKINFEYILSSFFFFWQLFQLAISCKTYIFGFWKILEVKLFNTWYPYLYVFIRNGRMLYSIVLFLSSNALRNDQRHVSPKQRSNWNAELVYWIMPYIDTYLEFCRNHFLDTFILTVHDNKKQYTNFWLHAFESDSIFSKKKKRFS